MFQKKSIFEEFIDLTGEYALDFWDRKGSTLFLLCFPFLAVGFVTVMAGKDMFKTFEDTKTAAFVIVCSAIWTGLFNSISVIAAERKNIKQRSKTPNFSYESFLMSRAFVQMILCIVQSFVLVRCFTFAAPYYDNDLPDHGVILNSISNEYWVSLFLIVFATDLMGLTVSAFVRKQEKTTMFSPYILIAQLLLSGSLFELKGSMKTISNYMISKWGMEALGATSRLNGLPARLHKQFPMITHEKFSEYTASVSHLQTVWLMLGLFIVVFLVLADIGLHQIESDTRSS